MNQTNFCFRFSLVLATLLISAPGLAQSAPSSSAMNEHLLFMTRHTQTLKDREQIALRMEHYLANLETYSIDHDGLPMELEVYRPDGETKATLILVHGLGAFGRLYAGAAALLADRGYRVVTVDLPGHGFSGGRRGDFTLEEAASQVAQALTWARSKYGGPIGLLGSSLGGYVSFLTASRFGGADAVLCHNLFMPQKYPFRFDRLKKNMVQILYPILPSSASLNIRHIVNPRKVVDDPTLLAMFEDEKSEQMTWRYSLRAVHSLATIHRVQQDRHLKVPFGVLVGSKDRLVSAQYTNEVFNMVKAPRKDLLTISDSGHLLFHEYLSETIPKVDRWFSENL